MIENETPLESWKEIAAYLQRNVVTVRRWEQNEGLPVHRHTHRTRASVYAYASEIDLWRASRKTLPEPTPPPPMWKTLLGHPRSWAFGATMALCLISIGNGIRPQAASAEGLSLRQIDLPSVDGPVVYNNGRQVIQVDWDGPAEGSLAVYDQKGKKTILQSGHCGRNDAVCTFADFPSLSPDQKSIAYTWYDDSVNDTCGQLRVVANTPGATPRNLVTRTDCSRIMTRGWTADGNQLLVVLMSNDHKTFQIGFVSVNSGELRTVKTIQPKEPFGDPSLSPDGRYIAYSALVENRPGVRHIYVMKSDGSAETELTRDAAASDTPLWTPDGRSLLYTSNQSGTVDLMALPIQDGKAAGPASLIKRDIGAVALTQIVASGSLYYTTINRVPSIFLADAAPSSGTAVAKVQEQFSGGTPRWSPDGKLLAFRRARSLNSDQADLFVRIMETGEERKYSLPGSLTGPPSWQGDSKVLLFLLTLDENSKATYFYRLDLATGAFEREASFSDGPGFFSEDGRTFYVAVQTGPKGVPQLFAVNVADGSRKLVAELEGTQAGRYNLNISPDRKLMGIVREDPKGRVYGIFTLSDGKYRELYRVPYSELDGPRQLTWRPDSGALLYARPNPPVPHQAGILTIMQIPVTGGAPVPTSWRVPDGGLINTFPHPTAPNQFALAMNGGQREFWMLENVTAAVAKNYATK